MEKEEFNKLAENPGLLNDDTLPRLKQLTEDYPFFHAARMLYLKNLQILSHSGFEAALAKAAVTIPDRKQLHRYLYSMVAVAASDYYFDQTGMNVQNSGQKSNEDVEEGSLIDRFLSTDPAPIKVEESLHEDISEEYDNEIIAKSASTPDELVTETLAMIYFEQKKYDQALDAFKKLSLKYPEKSVYFATRIEEIEKLKNI